MSCVLLMSLCLINANFPFCTDTSGQCYPEVVFANNQYYVFWCDFRYRFSEGNYAILGARVSASGNVLDPNGKVLFKRQSGSEPAAAFDGTNFLVAFRDSC